MDTFCRASQAWAEEIADFGLRISDFKCQTSDMKSEISDLESLISNLGPQIWDLRFQISNLKSSGRLGEAARIDTLLPFSLAIFPGQFHENVQVSFHVGTGGVE